MLHGFYTGFLSLFSLKLLACDLDSLGLERPYVPSEAKAGFVLMFLWSLSPSWQKSVRAVQNKTPKD